MCIYVGDDVTDGCWLAWSGKNILRSPTNGLSLRLAPYLHTFLFKQIHSAYAVVLCTVMEQVAFFSLTEYPPDGRSSVELAFERHLQFDKRGGFLLRLQINENYGTMNDEVLQVLLQRIQSLGGPKLLDRGPSKENDDDDNNDADGTDKQQQSSSDGPSFQSDRRIIRLIIARYWADLLMSKYLETTLASAAEND